MRKSILIYYEGETERLYIERLRRYFSEKYGLNKNHFLLTPRPESICIKLINKSIKEIKNNQWDHIFIITDREENIDRINKLKETEDYLDKIKKVFREKISIIVSNPTFEFWLCLHFENLTNKNITQKQLLQKLTDYNNKKYDKADEIWLENNIFNDFNKINSAIQNSRKIIENKNHKKYEFAETNFYEFIEYIVNIE